MVRAAGAASDRWRGRREAAFAANFERGRRPPVNVEEVPRDSRAGAPRCFDVLPCLTLAIRLARTPASHRRPGLPEAVIP